MTEIVHKDIPEGTCEYVDVDEPCGEQAEFVIDDLVRIYGDAEHMFQAIASRLARGAASVVVTRLDKETK